MVNPLALNDEVVCVVGAEISYAISSVNVGFLQAGTGAVARSVQGRLRDTVSVKDFGAVGDGATDDTAAIQTALTAASAAGGAMVYLTAGTYRVTGPLYIYSNTWVCGAGPATTIYTTSLSYSASSGHRIFHLENVDDIQISDMIFDAGSMTGFLGGMRVIWGDGCSNITVERCKFITPGAATAFLGCDNYQILNNHIEIVSTYVGGAVHDGIIDQWDGSHDFVIQGNHIQCNSIGLWAILVTGMSVGNITGTPVYNFHISNNTVLNCKNAGIWAMGRAGLAYNFTISDNIVDGVIGTSAGFGISVTDAHTFTLRGNVIKNTYSAGIAMRNESPTYGSYAVKYGTVADNVIHTANTAVSANVQSGSAIYIVDSSEYVSITDNVVIGTQHVYAIYMGLNTSNIEVTGNTVQSGTTGKFGEGSSSALMIVPGGVTYTATFTNNTNVSSAAGQVSPRYWRDGNYILVEGIVDVTPTASGQTQLRISLPVASNFTVGNECIGSAATVTSIAAAIYASTSTDTAFLEFVAPSTTTQRFYWQFRYLVV
jgi:hypothetical protein